MDEFENVNMDILVDNSIQLLNNKEFKDLTAYEMNIVTAMLGRLEYFSSMKESLGPQGLKIIAKCIKIKKFPAQSNVINYGEEGRTFYIILKGIANILVPDYKKKSKVLEFNKIMSLGRGSSFGVLAIINKKPRTATVTCEDDCVLAEIQYEDYVTLLKEIETPIINNFISYLKSFELFRNLPRSYLERFYFIGEKKYFKKGEIIFREGTPVDGIYLIKSGVISIYKNLVNYSNKLFKIEKDIRFLKKESEILLNSLIGQNNLESRYKHNLNLHLDDSKTGSSRINSMKPPAFFELVTVKDQEILGHMELFKEKNHNRVLTAICKTDVESHFFSRDKFSQLLTPFLIDSLKKDIEIKAEFYNTRYRNASNFYDKTCDSSIPKVDSYISKIKKLQLPPNLASHLQSSSFLKSFKSERYLVESPRKKIVFDESSDIQLKSPEKLFTGKSVDALATAVKNRVIKKSFIITDQIDNSLNYKAKLNSTTILQDLNIKKPPNVNFENKLIQINFALGHKLSNKEILIDGSSNKLNSKVQIFKKNGLKLKTQHKISFKNSVNSISTKSNSILNSSHKRKLSTSYLHEKYSIQDYAKFK